MKLPEGLTHKIGPLPAWGWGLAVVGGAGLFLLIRGKGSGSPASNVVDLGAGGTGGAGIPSGGGGGGGVETPTPTPIPTPTPTPTPTPDPNAANWDKLLAWLAAHSGPIPTPTPNPTPTPTPVPIPTPPFDWQQWWRDHGLGGIPGVGGGGGIQIPPPASVPLGNTPYDVPWRPPAPGASTAAAALYASGDIRNGGGGVINTFSNNLDPNNSADTAFLSQWFGGSQTKARQYLVNDAAMGQANNTYANNAALGNVGTTNPGYAGLSPVNQAYALAAQNGGDWTDYLAQTNAAANAANGAPGTLK